MEEHEKGIINNDEAPLLKSSTIKNEKAVELKISNWGMGYALAKTIDGAGVFALPWAARETGTLGFVIAMSVCCICGAWTMNWLCHLKRACGAHSYEEISRLALGDRTAMTTKWFLWFCVLGVCAAYVSFLAEMVPVASDWFSLLLAGIAVFPLAFIIEVRYIAKLARFGVFAVLFALVFVLFAPVVHPEDKISLQEDNVSLQHNQSFWAVLTRFGRAFGSIAFLFCVHFSVPSIEDEAASPEIFPRIAETVLTITGIANLLFGLIAAQLYASPSPIVINDIPQNNIRIAATVFLALDLLTAFPIVFNAALNGATSHENTQTSSLVRFSKPRLKLLFLVYLIAARRSFVAVAGFVGGLGQASLALVLPPILILSASGRFNSSVCASPGASCFLEDHQHSWKSKLRTISQLEAVGLLLVALLGAGLVLTTTATNLIDLFSSTAFSISAHHHS